MECCAKEQDGAIVFFFRGATASRRWQYNAQNKIILHNKAKDWNMKKYRLGVVGQGGRGRGMFRWFSENFEDIEPVAACAIVPTLWYDTT